jgi:hypothetical protein
MNAVVAHAEGFVAVGAAGAQPAAWVSATGRTWSEVTLPLPAGAVRAVLRFAAANGNTVAAVGTETTAAGTPLPFAAVSANGGATWSVTALPLPKPATAQRAGAAATGSGVTAGPAGPVTALAAEGGGFTATGTYGLSGQQDVVVWLLGHGAVPSARWTAATPEGTGLAGPGTQAITALTDAGVTLTGVGFSATAATEQPTIWQSPVRS